MDTLHASQYSSIKPLMRQQACHTVSAGRSCDAGSSKLSELMVLLQPVPAGFLLAENCTADRLARNDTG